MAETYQRILGDISQGRYLLQRGDDAFVTFDSQTKKTVSTSIKK